ncbi:energy transducer TonB [Ferriphaselus sp. R-1]|uniref:energy transducer TonB n=1 Tax=Ferriphaselus sp. R-1 TaxID=1485544 RepID=UPI001F2504F7|nr:energy transducer TonB [Ferriphaselus sp. R-1]
MQLAIWIKQRMTHAFAFSLLLHSFILFGVGLVLPDPRKALNALQPLEVTLVNSQSRSRPDQADALAQANLDGGGNTSADKQAKSPLPTLTDDKHFTEEQATQRQQQLEQENKKLMTQLKSSTTVERGHNPKQSQVGDSSGQDLMQRSLEIARLEAQINKDFDAYQKLPRRKFIGARTQEFRFAQYVEDWRAKVERIGNLNYPERARRERIFGSLQLTVSIRSDGSVENIEVSRSSGQPVLDDAAKRIVALAAPYAAFPPDIRRDTDILSITRTWTFTQTDKLESKN